MVKRCEVPPIVSGLLAAIIVWAARSRLLAGVLALLVLVAGALFISVPVVTLEVLIAILVTIDIATSLRTTRAAFREHRVQEAESKRVLAHELKTPLASMRGLTQLLGDFELTDAERKRVATLLESEAGKLQSMISGLLDLEKLPLRDFAASTSVTDLGKLVAARVDFLRAGTDRRLVMNAAPHVFLRTDAALVERVVDNLVGNALKYTAGAVSVSVRQNGSGAVLEVADEGPGMTAEDRERIFQRFFRGSSAAGTEGLGLGLSLVSEVARWHGGSARSSPTAMTLLSLVFRYFMSQRPSALLSCLAALWRCCRTLFRLYSCSSMDGSRHSLMPFPASAGFSLRSSGSD